MRLSNLLLLILGIACLTAAACHSGPRNYLNENDDLRRQNLELRQKVDDLQKQIELRLAQIDTLNSSRSSATQPGLEGADVPHAVKLELGRYTGTVDTNGDGIDDTLRIYLKTLDQQGRFLPAAGRAVVQLVAIAPGTAPTLIAEKTFDPQEFDAAYRSGMTGTHYTIEVPLPAKPPAGQATAKLTFTDAATHATLSAETSVKLRVQ